MRNTKQVKSPCAIDVTVVKRGHSLQLVAFPTILGVVHKLETSRLLIAGKKTPDQALEAFMVALTAGAEPQSATAEGELVLNCSVAMEDLFCLPRGIQFALHRWDY